ENELGTSIALEQGRKELVDLEGFNNLKKAEFEAKALTAKLGPYKEFPHQSLLALSLKELAQNAEKIGNLTFTPEILASILNGK
ncbi:hypothetical protein HYY75_08530, partial [bacterium]|nr:hypothetical protein [bacterium]